jgi:peptidyl-prolyl cis-trans isomerase C
MSPGTSLLQKTILAAALLPIIFSVSSAAETAATVPAPQAVSAGDDLVARVNGRGITALQLKYTVNSLITAQPNAKLSPETMKKVNKNVLDTLIARELLYQAGMKLEIKDLDKLVKEKIAKGRARFSSEADFRKALGSADISDKELYDNVLQEIVIENFIAKTIDAKISVSEKEIKDVYDQNIENVTQAEQIRINYILIGTDSAMKADERIKAREKAEKLRKELLKGASIIELARKYSTDSSSEVGGDVGYTTRKQLEPVFAQAAFALKPGELSQVVETKAGYFIIKMRDRRPSVTKSLAEVRPQIEEELKKLKSDAATQQFLAEARKNAKIEILLK